MRPRKTIPVTEIKDDLNRRLKSNHLTGDEKAVICTVLEGILHSSGNYKGFMFVNQHSRPGDKDYYTRTYY